VLHFSKNLILASASPRRKTLLQFLGISFSVYDSEIEEKLNPQLTPQENVQLLSYKKAYSVAQKNTSAIILGADTIVCLNGKTFGKPSDSTEAKQMLSALSGNTHTVYTGFTILETPSYSMHTSFEATEVTFRKMTDDEIEFYVTKVQPFDKAGAYGIQDDFGAVFIERINGDFYNVVGLPLCKVFIALQQFSLK
jgi:septum formation protein